LDGLDRYDRLDGLDGFGRFDRLDRLDGLDGLDRPSFSPSHLLNFPTSQLPSFSLLHSDFPLSEL
jgi:hypothetical protein